MTAIPSFSYELLWGERVVRSVANLTRSDGHELFRAVREHPVTTIVEVFPLAAAEDALDRLRAGAVRGAAVLAVGDPRGRRRPGSA
jgi:propanol-preferring alcohol dehydrogenase